MPDHKMMFVGEAWSAEDARLGQSFSGTSGSIFNGLLRQAGINRDECINTHVFNFQPPSGDINNLLTKEQKDAAEGWPTFAPRTWVDAKYSMSLYELTELRKACSPNVIVAMGGTALWALTHQRGIEKKRGAPLLTFDGLHKVIPTWHPIAIMRQWELRAIAYLDIVKAKRESAFPDLRRPHRIITYAASLEEISDFYERFIRAAEFVACDIETKSRQITEIGFAPSADRCLVIPFWQRAAKDGNYWPDLRSERAAWEWVRRILAEKPTVGQNFQYDMAYLYETVGIPCPKFAGDTMLLHHAMQPELKKSLGFLGSIYTSEPAWKFMRSEAENETLKKED